MNTGYCCWATPNSSTDYVSSYETSADYNKQKPGYNVHILMYESAYFWHACQGQMMICNFSDTVNIYIPYT